LLRGASALVVATSIGGAAAHAQTAAILRGAAHLSNAAGVPEIVTAGQATPAPLMSPAMTSASGRAIQNQAKAAAALSMAQQAQQAARAAAAALNPAIGDGLWSAANPTGGLRSAVTKPTAASLDSTGLATWQGAALPTSTSANGQTTVTVNQTDPRAILSWTSYDVGANTTLVYAPASGTSANSSWVTLNRVVGGINPTTGLRDPAAAPAPSQILGQIKAPWQVLILNPNGVLSPGPRR
jgi:hypothetical protein